MKKMTATGKTGSGIMIRSQLMTMTSTTAFDTANIAYAATLPTKTGSAKSSPKHADAVRGSPYSNGSQSIRTESHVFDSKTFSPPRERTRRLVMARQLPWN